MKEEKEKERKRKFLIGFWMDSTVTLHTLLGFWGSGKE